MGKGKTLPVAPGNPGFPWDPFGGLTQPAPENKKNKLVTLYVLLYCLSMSLGL